MPTTYTYDDAEGVAHAIAPGETFTTPTQRIDTPEESVAALGAPLGSYVACEVQHAFTDLAGYDADLLARWAIIRVDEPDPPPPAPGIPLSVQRYQGKLALRHAGLLDAVKDLVAASDDPDVAILFDDKPTWERNDATLLGLAAQMTPPLTDDQIDALFVDAATR